MAKATATIQQAGLADLRLALELPPPIAKPLQRKIVQLAILTLNEPLTRPIIVMKPPETLQFRALLPADPRLCPSPRQYGLRRIGSRRRSTE
ncbi:MAG: hypothetical protein O9972_58655, partial [Burkholderiales bacterium]|nr:hypothetical protein [Burkholderiales bacterium]